MTHVNGGATHEPLTPPTTQLQDGGENGQGVQIPPERLQQIRELLAEAFDPAQIKWRVTATDTANQAGSPEARPIGGLRRPARLHGPAERCVR